MFIAITSTLAAIAMTGLLAIPAAQACGPDFPSSYLETDGEATLPWIDFGYSLFDIAKTYQLLPPGTPKFSPSRLRGIEAEAADFTARLNEPDLKPRLGDADRAGLVARYRAAIQAKRSPGQPPNLQFPLALQSALREFSLYHDGVAWLAAHPNSTDIPHAWTELLALPPDQRCFRTTWCLYMTGILHAKAGRIEESRKAYQAVRDTANAAFRDTCGLAYASFRREFFDSENEIVRRLASAPAAILFYSQYPEEREFRRLTLDLQAVCRQHKILTKSVLKKIAADPVASEVFIAFCADRYHVDNATTDRFLALLPPQPLKGAERMAFLAYTRNDIARTQKWLTFTPVDSLIGLWLQAELHRRVGKYDRAADAYRAWLRRYEELARNAKPVPFVFDCTAPLYRWRPPFVLNTTTAVPFFDDTSFCIGRTFDQEIQARLGTTLVHKRDFLQALDGFIRAAAWTDAAYVAETLVPLDDLRKYVDAASTPEIVQLYAKLNLNAMTPTGAWCPHDDPYAVFYPKDDDSIQKLIHANSVDTQRVFLRYLLGRRLIREGRAADATPYLPTAFQADAQRLATDLATAQNANLPADTRAVACYNAARILRWRGMELTGTELYPDARYVDGSFFFGVNPSFNFRQILPAQDFTDTTLTYDGGMVHTPQRTPPAAHDTESEPVCRPAAAVTLAQLKQPQPTHRFHYRLRAADLMLQTAALTTSPQLKAMALHVGGSWLRFRDRDTAYRLFYKRLVKECRGVDLGAEAAKHGCFPQNPTPWLYQQLTEASPALKSVADIPERLVEPDMPKSAKPEHPQS